MNTVQNQDDAQTHASPAADAGTGGNAGRPLEAGAEAAGKSLDEQLKAALAERDSFSQKWLLAVADLDNYRRRILKEMEQDRRYAVLPLARDVLPALDNLHRALEAAKTGGDVAQLASGVQMVARQFDEILARHSITAINAAGQPFDPNLHQAIQQMPAPGKPAMTVLNELERGYRMHDRVVRPSTVIVAAPDGPA
jgi:molecular chaperone GrpE